MQETEFQGKRDSLTAPSVAGIAGLTAALPQRRADSVETKDDQAGKQGKDEQASKQADAKPKRVLVLDDEPDTADSARQVLERFIPGVQVEVAGSARLGLAVLQDHPVDLALVDYKLPGRNGLEFVRRAHELEPGLPVILMTAFGSVDIAARAINEHRVEAFLPKPLDAVVLADTVRKALERNEPQPAAASAA